MTGYDPSLSHTTCVVGSAQGYPMFYPGVLLVLSVTLFETYHKLEPLYVEWLCNFVSNQQDCTTNYK